MNPGGNGTGFYSCSQSDIKSQKRISLKKCRCQSVWCPVCRYKSLARVSSRLSLMDWSNVRHVVVTVDREIFDDGQSAYEYISDKKSIAGLMRNLERDLGRVVNDWLWVIEFHKDGFPHWHILIDSPGGMIGGDWIRKHWTFGKYVRESYIKSERHWGKIFGYFGKHGYFGEEKGAQGVLPSWALEYDKKIRRYGAKRISEPDGEIREKKIKSEKKGDRVMRPYSVILSGCGQKTLIMISYEESGLGYGGFHRVNCPVKEIAEGFNFLQGEYFKDFDYEGFISWFESHPLLRVLWGEIRVKYFDLFGEPVICPAR